MSLSIVSRNQDSFESNFLAMQLGNGILGLGHRRHPDTGRHVAIGLKENGHM